MFPFPKYRPKFACRGNRSRGFSLIEIAIAIGILGVSILPIIGLLSVGLTQSEDSVKNTVTAHILSQVDALVRQTAFTDLKTNTSGLYFDDEGDSIDTALLSTHPEKVLWKATWTVEPTASLPSASSDLGTLSTAKLVRIVTSFAPNGQVVASRTQTNFLYVNDRGQ